MNRDGFFRHPSVDKSDLVEFTSLKIGIGCGASSGAVTGALAFTAEDVATMKAEEKHRNVVFCKENISEKDKMGLEVA